MHQDLLYETSFFELLSERIVDQLLKFIQYNPDDLGKSLMNRIIKKAIVNIPKKNNANCFLKKGGNGNNTAEYCASLGIPTKLISVIGKSSNWMIDELNASGVNTDLIFKNDLLTPVSTILKSNFTTKIFIAQNLKEKMNFEGINIDTNVFNTSKVLYITPIADKFKKFLKISKKLKIFTCLNIEAQKIRSFEHLESLIENKIDVLFINKDDANLILNQILSLDETDGYFKKFANIRVYTVGNEGSYLLTDNVKLTYPTIQLENVKDRTGAGDCYAAGFLSKLFELTKDKSSCHALLQDNPLDQIKEHLLSCMELGTYSALYKISTQAVPKKDDLKRFIRKIKTSE
ncbi:MAG: carbohydrate kinase family protein [Candidatus Lokiarchaeota archaeon]